MGILAWLTGKRPKPDVIHPWPNDHEIAGKLATLIEFHLYQEPRGLEQLLKPTCMVILGKDGSISFRWPSSPEVMKEYVNDIVSFAFLNDLPAFKNFVETISSFSKLDGNKGLVADWLKLVGPTEVDNIVVEALREMKRKCEQRLARAEKSQL